jgi:hypothetical protein
MPRGKHTRCSQCGQRGEYRYLEVLWRKDSRGPWHYVGGYVCGADARSLVGFISDVSPVQLLETPDGRPPS